MKCLMVLALVVAMSLMGCAISLQRFEDNALEFNDVGDIIAQRVITGKSKTIAPPFGSKAMSKHSLEMAESLDDWNVKMGSVSELDGGELATTIAALEKFMESTILEPLR